MIAYICETMVIWTFSKIWKFRLLCVLDVPINIRFPKARHINQVIHLLVTLIPLVEKIQ